jgi:Ca-activated chloride channel family protein
MKARIRIAAVAASIVLISGAFILTKEKHTNVVPDPEPGTISFEFCPENSYWLPEAKKDEFYLFVLLKAGDKPVTADAERTPLNLSLVVDRSGSMEGDKIKYTKQAVDYVINQLGENDRISIVEYSDEVNVLASTQSIGDRSKLHNKVASIHASGSTNLSGGMVEGFNQVGSSRKNLSGTGVGQNYVHRVLLMSDGLANKGVTEPDGITALVDQYFESDNVSISTFGVGADYNENLMAGIATRGRGHYEFIESPEDLPRIFDQELKGISSLMAKETKLQITFPESEMELDKVYQFSNKLKGNTIEIDLADMFANDQRGVLIRFKTKPNVSAPFSFTGKLSYQDANKGMEFIERTETANITLARNDADIDRGFNVRAEQGYALLVGSEEFSLAMENADNRNFKDAATHLENALDILEQHFDHVEPHPFLKEIYKDMTEYKGTLKELEKMKEPKYRRSYSVFQKKAKAKKFRTISCPSF